MSLLFIDSFDHYIDGADKYLVGGSTSTTGRHGQGWGASGGGTLRLSPTPTHSRVIVGAAFRFDSTFNQFVELVDIGGPVAGVETTNEGALMITTYGGPNVRSVPDLIRVGRWHYIEWDATVVISAGGLYGSYTLTPATVYLDGTAVVTSASLGPTINATGPPSAVGWTYLNLWVNGYGVMDDLYVCDGAGPAPHNAPLGDVEIDVIRPNGAGSATAWTPTGVVSNWDAVNDLVPDGETTRVTATTAGLSDLYEMEDVNTSNGILGAQILISARRTEEHPASLAPLLRHAGTTTALTARTLSSSYFYRNRNTFVTMPNGDPLTDANMNALQAGFTRTV